MSMIYNAFKERAKTRSCRRQSRNEVRSLYAPWARKRQKY